MGDPGKGEADVRYRKSPAEGLPALGEMVGEGQSQPNSGVRVRVCVCKTNQEYCTGHLLKAARRLFKTTITGERLLQ